VTLCTRAIGCAINLTNPKMYEVAGVAQARNGDCWASANSSSSTTMLVYFSGCSGPGQIATGFRNADYGGLDIDSRGNLVAISTFDAKLYVYRGCTPRCRLVGGPFALEPYAIFGHLNEKSTLFAAANFSTSKIDVYKYSPSNVKYEYSFDNGLNGTYDVEGVAFNPRSKE
ncbi:MAG: hypothetical protein JO104_05945, partial [Candidatus Eremiobacteraeota bacterium]|nr:hypothetical protein [Candidatus Eremiobacteraeota bacterium]